jgi:hypothetical protein
MRRLLLLAILALAALPGAASAAGCSPLSCAPFSTALNGTHLLAVQNHGAQSAVQVLDLTDGQMRWQLPRGILAGTTLVHHDGAALAWLDATTGTQTARRSFPSFKSWFLTGVSIDGKRAVLFHAKKRPQTTSFALVGAETRVVTLPGNWEFDALTGQRLYLLHYLTGGYEVRLFDLARNRLAPLAIKNGDEGTLIDGIAWSRLTSWDGRYVFTLYINSASEAMIHELDLRTGTARCIDLPGSADFTAAAGYGLALTPDGKTVWAASAAYGRAVAVDVASAKVRSGFTFKPWKTENPTAPAIALNARADMLALSVEGHTEFLDLKAKRMRLGATKPAIAIGFSPDGSKLWAIDPNNATVALDVPS